MRAAGGRAIDRAAKEETPVRETILVDRDGAVATIVLNRPDVLNAVDRKMRHELLAAMGELNADAPGLAIVLTGSGNSALPAGQDMGELSPLDADGGPARVSDLGRVSQSNRRSGKP